MILPSTGSDDGETTSASQPLRKGTETLLLVEDESFLSTLTKTLLESEGYHVLTAEDGERAVQVYTAHQKEISLVLTDVVLPGMNGVQVVQSIRKLTAAIPVIFITGSVDKDFNEKINMLQPCSVIQKPFDMRGIVAAIRSIIDR